MVKVKHTGLKPVNINVFGNTQYWNGNEVRDISEQEAIKISENPRFIIVKEDIKENVIETPVKKKKTGIGGN